MPLALAVIGIVTFTSVDLDTSHPFFVAAIILLAIAAILLIITFVRSAKRSNEEGTTPTDQT